ncbi:hypothetical protein RRG08_039897 [Elysia crispata]|uniref:Uncharacterized protein n=1 Tax=Elysia crispata TaxID=231223 RepID=A0AAE1DML4_9GAST|nr:hypothetical protein RRG08_039897 [Elysia crispata]
MDIMRFIDLKNIDSAANSCLIEGSHNRAHAIGLHHNEEIMMSLPLIEGRGVRADSEGGGFDPVPFSKKLNVTSRVASNGLMGLG